MLATARSSHYARVGMGDLSEMDRYGLASGVACEDYCGSIRGTVYAGKGSSLGLIARKPREMWNVVWVRA
jgi:hypothetical protein